MEKNGGMRMKIMVLDAQGGGVGKEIIRAIRKEDQSLEILAVGTNSSATSAMLKAGATRAATGENPVLVNAPKADIIVGPLGIAIADSMMGEITPAMARAVACSDAKRILIPFDQCGSVIVGLRDMKLSSMIQEAVDMVFRLTGRKA